MCITELRLSRERILHNLAYLKNFLRPSVKILVNLKANAYGHGAVLVGRFLDDKVDFFSVACQWEGEQLRKAGISTPILVFNPPVEWNLSFFENRLIPAIYHIEQFTQLIEFVQKHHLKNIAVHVKLDTGMHRSGLMPEVIPQVIELLKNQKELQVAGVFSHLAAADDPTEDDFTRLQFARFEKFSKPFLEINPHLIRHLANSSAILRFPGVQYDMVRLGLSVYGISPVEGEAEKKLKPVGRLVSRITQIRKIPAGDTVGYNRLFVAKRPSVIALIPTGYADGYKRVLGQGVGKVLLNGKEVPVIGKVSMDMITLDITDVPAKIGDEVILFGDRPHAAELARLTGTIPYEITTSVGARVRRVWQSF